MTTPRTAESLDREDFDHHSLDRVRLERRPIGAGSAIGLLLLAGGGALATRRKLASA